MTVPAWKARNYRAGVVYPIHKAIGAGASELGIQLVFEDFTNALICEVPIFRDNFCGQLRELFKQDRLQFHGSLRQLASLGAFSHFLWQLGQKDWVVYAKPPFGGTEHVLNYLARYTHRVAISNHRLVAFEYDRVASESGKAANGMGISISANGDVQLAGANVNAGSIGVQNRQRVKSSFALLGHLLLRLCWSNARGADTEQTPNRDRRREPAAVITRLYATPDPRLSVGLQTGTNVGAGCSCHPTGPTIIARLAFLCILSGHGQLHAYQCLSVQISCIEVVGSLRLGICRHSESLMGPVQTVRHRPRQ